VKYTDNKTLNKAKNHSKPAKTLHVKQKRQKMKQLCIVIM